MRLSFNEYFAEKSTYVSCKQYMRPTDFDANVAESEFQLYPNSRLVRFQHVCVLNNGSRILFRGFTSTEFSKIFIKTGFYVIVHTFKNYFVSVFLVFNFQ